MRGILLWLLPLFVASSAQGYTVTEKELLKRLEKVEVSSKNIQRRKIFYFHHVYFQVELDDLKTIREELKELKSQIHFKNNYSSDTKVSLKITKII